LEWFRCKSWNGFTLVLKQGGLLRTALSAGNNNRREVLILVLKTERLLGALFMLECSEQSFAIWLICGPFGALIRHSNTAFSRTMAIICPIVSFPWKELKLAQDAAK
jgi:hypothetical protein